MFGSIHLSVCPKKIVGHQSHGTLKVFAWRHNFSVGLSGETKPFYINVVREPTAQYVSGYYYAIEGGRKDNMVRVYLI